jgi:hypothetical protein
MKLHDLNILPIQEQRYNQDAASLSRDGKAYEAAYAAHREKVRAAVEVARERIKQDELRITKTPFTEGERTVALQLLGRIDRTFMAKHIPHGIAEGTRVLDYFKSMLGGV